MFSAKLICDPDPLETEKKLGEIGCIVGPLNLNLTLGGVGLFLNVVYFLVTVYSFLISLIHVFCYASKHVL